MLIRYNYESMHECSNALNNILKEGINNDSMERFYKTAMNVDWCGPNADDFRTEVSRMKELYEEGVKLFPQVFESLANRPKTFAEKIGTLELNLKYQQAARMYE